MHLGDTGFNIDNIGLTGFNIDNAGVTRHHHH